CILLVHFLIQFISVLFYGQITTDFKPCIEFFYAETIPQGISGDGYQALCQYYESQYHFATLYDRNRRIPLFSAYILSPGEGSRPTNTNWMIEPRVSYVKYHCVMFKDSHVFELQAVNEDYKHSGYTRGHLAPSGHQQTEEDKKATFTLTNIVPQMEKFNNGPWKNLEERMAERLKVCTSKMYVITGVMPYKEDEPKINNRVTVPEYFWTAYCCPTLTAGLQNYFPTFADLEKNLQKRLKMPKMSLFKNEYEVIKFWW
uniref:Uncharacterized protein n=1 Tax=Pundamilia nyererei TaxID=303518 RepID=A0A3B4EZ94_9CICH